MRATRSCRRPYAQQEPLADILGHAEKSIFDIVMRRTEGSTLVHIADILPDTYQRIETLSRLKGAIDGVPTGFVDLDNLLTGLHGGELVLVARALRWARRPLA